MRKLTDEARPSDIGKTADPDDSNACQPHFKGRQFPLEENNEVAHDRNGDGKVRDDERQSVTEVREETAGLTEGIGGVPAEPPAFAAEHAAFGEDVADRRRPGDGYHP